MGKIDIEFRPESSQRSVGGVKQGVCGRIVRRTEPFAFEYAPQCFCYIQMRTVRRQEKEVKTTFFPGLSSKFVSSRPDVNIYYETGS